MRGLTDDERRILLEAMPDQPYEFGVDMTDEDFAISCRLERRGLVVDEWIGGGPDDDASGCFNKVTTLGHAVLRMDTAARGLASLNGSAGER